MSVLSLIIKREFFAKVRNKTFIVMTFLSPLLFVLFAFLIGYLTSLRGETKKIAIHDQSGLFFEQFENNEAYLYTDLSAIDIEILKKDVLDEKYEGVLFIPHLDNTNTLQDKIVYISNDSPSMAFVSKVEGVIEVKLTSMNLTQMGIEPQVIDKAKANVNLNLVKASGESTIKGLNEIKIFLGGIFGYMIMMFIIIYGNMVMRSVIEEKTNRIIEIIISSVKPFDLMMGKIIGTSLAGILQFVIWGILGGVLLAIGSSVLGVQPGASTAAIAATENSSIVSAEMSSTFQLYVGEILSLPLFSLLGFFILFFIGGYFLYSSVYAAIGAAVDNETDSQQFILPIITPLMLAVYIGFFTVVNDPHGTVATVFSMIPFTSPIVMLMRIPFGVPLWQVILSLVILFTTFIGVVWFAAKIYRIGILMFGKKPTYREIFKWLKY